LLLTISKWSLVKHARKKQKTVEAASEVQPLGSHTSLMDDATKDEEERRRERILFGTCFVPSGVESANLLVLSDGEDNVMDGAGRELENVMDTDVSIGYHLK
jgi:U3 small nucleolar RNA-associated protein 18